MIGSSSDTSTGGRENKWGVAQVDRRALAPSITQIQKGGVRRRCNVDCIHSGYLTARPLSQEMDRRERWWVSSYSRRVKAVQVRGGTCNMIALNVTPSTRTLTQTNPRICCNYACARDVSWCGLPYLRFDHHSSKMEWPLDASIFAFQLHNWVISHNNL